MARGDWRSLYRDMSPTAWMIEVDDYFLQSTVSYYGLSSLVPHYGSAASVIKGRVRDITRFPGGNPEVPCRKLYGLLHQRFITSDDGIRRLHEKYRHGIYGKCPRVACTNHHLLPMGLTIEPGVDTVKLWCPKCHDVYDCDSDIDGAYFGPDIPIMFMKLCRIPLRFRAESTLIDAYQKLGGSEVPAIAQRLHRWGERKRK